MRVWTPLAGWGIRHAAVVQSKSSAGFFAFCEGCGRNLQTASGQHHTHVYIRK